MRGLGWMEGLIDRSMYDIFGMDGWPARQTNVGGVQLRWMARLNGQTERCMRCLIWMDE